MLLQMTEMNHTIHLERGREGGREGERERGREGRERGGRERGREKRGNESVERQIYKVRGGAVDKGEGEE